MRKSKTLLHEDNIISLRTAIIVDNGDIVFFTLLPKVSEIAAAKNEGCGRTDSTWLYRHKKSFVRELFIKADRFHIRQDLKPMEFRTPPSLNLVWADSGESVALLLNGEPWALIHEKNRHGFSKGVLRTTAGNLWDQKLFESIFGER